MCMLHILIMLVANINKPEQMQKGEKIMLFKVRHRKTGKIFTLYALAPEIYEFDNSDLSRFLIFDEKYGWRWERSYFFEPVEE